MAECSKWCPSRFSAWSAFFLIYINDIDQGVVSKLCKFADDTKFGAKVGDTFGVEDLRADLKNYTNGLWNGKINVIQCR